jgi:hypothetical protein
VSGQEPVPHHHRHHHNLPVNRSSAQQRPIEKVWISYLLPNVKNLNPEIKRALDDLPHYLCFRPKKYPVDRPGWQNSGGI